MMGLSVYITEEFRKKYPLNKELKDINFGKLPNIKNGDLIVSPYHKAVIQFILASLDLKLTYILGKEEVSLLIEHLKYFLNKKENLCELVEALNTIGIEYIGDEVQGC